MTRDQAGLVLSIHRYPVKSMQGEQIDVCEVTERGLLGDRAFALVDISQRQSMPALRSRPRPLTCLRLRQASKALP